MRPRLNLASSLFCKGRPTLEDSKLQFGQATTRDKHCKRIFYFSFLHESADASIFFSVKTKLIFKQRNLIPWDKSVKNLPKGIMCQQEEHLLRGCRGKSTWRCLKQRVHLRGRPSASVQVWGSVILSPPLTEPHWGMIFIQINSKTNISLWFCLTSLKMHEKGKHNLKLAIES